MPSDVDFEKVAEIRDYMRDVVEPEELDFCNWGILDQETLTVKVSCHTPACLAGHICAYYEAQVNSMIRVKAAKILGLSFDQAQALFQPVHLPEELTWDLITPAHVVKVLDNFIETEGTVDWYILGDEHANTPAQSQPGARYRD